MRAAILANGRLPGRTPGLRRRIETADLVICADGGLRAARRLGVRPNVVIGDLDSVPRALVTSARAGGAVVLVHPTEKDKTDTELALDYALARGAGEVEFFGALGGRLDHLLANVGLLLRAADRRARLRIVDGATEAFLAGRRTALEARPGDCVSLLPLSPTASGVTTRGLRYPLRQATLEAGSSLGVSNVVTSTPASVSVRAGRLLVVITHRL